MTARRFVLPFLFGALGYAGLIIGLVWVQLDGKENNLAFVYGVLPVLPGMIMLGAVMSAFREMDELERRIHGEAVIIAFLISVMVFFSYGLLQAFSDFPPMNLGLASGVMTAVWGMGVLVAWRRYR